jgi:cell division protein FtsI (penicillin-binding protein 3)
MKSKSVGFHSTPALNVRMPMWRGRLVAVLLLLGLVTVAGKALYLQGMSQDFLQRQGERRYERTLVLPATRGKIFDREGIVLASSIPARAIWAIPDDAKEIAAADLAKLAKLLDLPLKELKARLAVEDKNFVYLKRQLAVARADEIKALKLPGIHQQGEERRIYPESGVTAQLLGFTNVEGRGIEGVELTFDAALSGQPGSRRVIKDRLGRVVEDVRAVMPPVDGQDLRLSIDAGLQFAAYSALNKAMQENKAAAAAGVILDARTGEVLALVNLPTYDSNERDERKGAALRNRVITDTFEPGSIMKPFTAALALDLKRINTRTTFDTGAGQYQYQGHTISDVSRNGTLDVAGVLRRSSNIGMTMISERLTSQEMWTKFTELGFGRAPQTSFPGVASGLLRPWERWRPIERATMAYGYGLSVSLLQMAQAYTAFARDGDMVSLSLLRREGQPASVRVYSPEVAATIRAMLEAAAGPDGAKLAQVQGYRVAGKSGTARKIVGGQYSKTRYRSSFVGFAPVSDPRIVVAISIDEPQGAYFGGRVAAPVFADIVASSLRRLGVQPDAKLDGMMATGSQVEVQP